MTLTIRDAAPQDAAQWHDLWAGYLGFYGVSLPPEVTAHTWARLVNPASSLTGRFAFEGAQMLGFALHFRHESTWVIGEDCYLEDLFVADSARGKGVGRALIADLRHLAETQGCARLYWMADAENARARALYDSIAPCDGHLRYRLQLRG
ncbi:GNAT family N-acetyltransferase [Gemmobacter serpentinus]|uniref:GNAT family N-acetyltransferase n=1 Tax=Gemmobacter serpentinus TaxID=2652247 RepID=UPI00124D8128|nr:GNAT family N-acetyltransferase [Gemmobacter serpentinus]